MSKFANASLTATAFDEGGPARRLCAAALPVIESIEGRQMMSASAIGTLVDAQVTTTAAKTVSTAKQAQNPSGTSVWVNPNDSAKSLVISTNQTGGLNVYDLNGNIVQHVTTGQYTDVDVRNNVMLSGKRVSLVSADNSTTNTVDLFAIDSKTRELTLVGSVKPTASGTVDGLTMYHSESGNTYVFVSTTTGAVEQIQLAGTATHVTGSSVRTINVGSAADSLVADDATGSLYVSQNGVAIWKYGADATDGSVRIEIDSTHGHMGESPESLALYTDTDGSGYLIASRNDTNDYAVYDRESGDYVTKFTVNQDGASSASAIAAAGGAINSKLPGGMFVVQDESAGSENLKIVSWSDIANQQSSPLVVNTAKVATKTSTYKTTRTQADVAVNSLDLYQANTNNKLQTLSTGTVIDLGTLKGKSLNIRANTDIANVGSVVFTVNGKIVRTEETSSYDLAGSAGTWAPSVGTYTITATAYSSSHGHGVQGTAQTITITVVDSSKSGGTTSSTTSTASSTGSTASTGSTSSTSSTKSTTSTSTSTSTTTAKSTSSSSASSNTTAAASSGTSTTTSTASTPVTTTQTGQPSASNTGVKSGTTLTTVSNFTAQSNTTYTNLSIKGLVNLKGLTNVTLINCKIDAGGTMWAIRCDSCSNIVIQNCEITNASAAAVYGDHFKAIGNYIHNIGGDGFKPLSDALIQGNFITALGYDDPSAHADGVQISGGSNISIVGNFFDMPIDQANCCSNSSMFIQNDVTNITFSGNWCVGGNYTIHAYADNAGGNATIKITDNVFYSGSCRYGFGQVGDGVVWSGNVTDGGSVATSAMS